MSMAFRCECESVAVATAALERELERRLREYETSSERSTKPLFSAPAPTTPMYSIVIIVCGIEPDAASGCASCEDGEVAWS